MFEQHHDQIRREAIEAYPEEAVWLITSDGCERVENVAPRPEEAFSVSNRDMARAFRKGLLAVVHSHPGGPDCPTAPDMRSQVQTAVPWGIITTDGEGALPIFWWGQDDIPPLQGRGFRHGVTDCYALIRDYYRLEHQIVLPEYPRDWEWWLKGESLYEDNFLAAGFRRIDASEAREGDMWFAEIRSKVPNHGGVLLGNDLILHHPAADQPVDTSRLSRREPIHRWLKFITHWLRHDDL